MCIGVDWEGMVAVIAHYDCPPVQFLIFEPIPPALSWIPKYVIFLLLLLLRRHWLIDEQWLFILYIYLSSVQTIAGQPRRTAEQTHCLLPQQRNLDSIFHQEEIYPEQQSLFSLLRLA